MAIEISDHSKYGSCILAKKVAGEFGPLSLVTFVAKFVWRHSRLSRFKKYCVSIF